MTTAILPDELVHECPLHSDGIDFDALSAYDRRWLELACSEISYYEFYARRAEAEIKRTRTRRDETSVGRHAFAGRQMRVITHRCNQIRAQMRWVLGTPASEIDVETFGPDVDLWAR